MLLEGINTEECLAQNQFCLAVSAAQDAVMPDLHETIGQDMKEKATDKLGSLQGHQSNPIVILAVSIWEGDLTSLSLEMAIRWVYRPR